MFTAALLMACFIVTSVVSRSQNVYKYLDGEKYPAGTKIDLRKPIGPANFDRMNRPDRMAGLKSASSAPSVHQEQVYSYSSFYGYTIRKDYTYNCDGNPVLILIKSQSGTSWIDSERYLYTYDQDGNMLTEVYQILSGSTWLDQLTYEYTYNGSADPVSVLFTNYISSPDFIERITYTYDPSGNISEELGEVFNGSSFEEYEKYTYTYDAMGNRLTMLGQLWYGYWDNYIRETWTWYAYDKWLTDLFEFWDGTDWIFYSNYINTYDPAGNHIQYVGEYYFDFVGWIPLFSGVYTYDLYGNMITNTQQESYSYDVIPIWENVERTEASIDYSSMEIEANGFLWSGSEWVTGDIRISVPFNDNGTQVVFADEYPSYMVVVLYSPVELTEVDAGDDVTIYIGYPPTSAQLNATGAETYVWTPAAGLSNPAIPNPVAMPAVTTTYTVTGTDSQGCTDSDEVTVNVIDVRCGKKLEKVLVCQVPPGNPGNAKTVCVSPNAVPALLASGSYLGPCITQNTPLLQDDPSDHEFTISVQPNPVSDGFLVRIYSPADEKFVISLYDRQGRMVQEVYNGELSAGENEIQVSSLQAVGAGMYLLRAVSPTVNGTVKLIKQ